MRVGGLADSASFSPPFPAGCHAPSGRALGAHGLGVLFLALSAFFWLRFLYLVVHCLPSSLVAALLRSALVAGVRIFQLASEPHFRFRGMRPSTCRSGCVLCFSAPRPRPRPRLFSFTFFLVRASWWRSPPFASSALAPSAACALSPRSRCVFLSRSPSFILFYFRGRRAREDTRRDGRRVCRHAMRVRISGGDGVLRLYGPFASIPLPSLPRTLPLPSSPSLPAPL